jgi:hypothetical protein
MINKIVQETIYDLNLVESIISFYWIDYSFLLKKIKLLWT